MIYQGYQLYKHDHSATLNITVTSDATQKRHARREVVLTEIDDEIISDPENDM
jgi:hypothetical protein